MRTIRTNQATASTSVSGSCTKSTGRRREKPPWTPPRLGPKQGLVGEVQAQGEKATILDGAETHPTLQWGHAKTARESQP